MQTPRRRLLASIIGLLVLIGAGCSGDDQSVAANDDPATPGVTDSNPADDHNGGDAAEAHDGATTVPDGSADSDAEADHAGDPTGGDSAVQPTQGAEGDVDLVVPVEMNEWGYALAETNIPVGSTVRFDFVNVGVVEHEAMFGTMHEQEEFEGDGHGDHGDEGHHGMVQAITLDPGEAGSLVVDFDDVGEILIGCHLPGHWNAGMVTALTIG